MWQLKYTNATIHIHKVNIMVNGNMTVKVWASRWPGYRHQSMLEVVEVMSPYRWWHPSPAPVWGCDPAPVCQAVPWPGVCHEKVPKLTSFQSGTHIHTRSYRTSLKLLSTPNLLNNLILLHLQHQKQGDSGLQQTMFMICVYAKSYQMWQIVRI